MSGIPKQFSILPYFLFPPLLFAFVVAVVLMFTLSAQTLGRSYLFSDAVVVLETKIEIGDSIEIENYPISHPIFKSLGLPTSSEFRVDGKKFVYLSEKSNLGLQQFQFTSGLRGNDYQIIIENVLADVDIEQIESQILEILGSEESLYGVYFYDLLREVSGGINDLKTFPPASISKVPTALLVLRDIDAGKYHLSSNYPMKNHNKPYSYGNLYYVREGTDVSLQTYLWESIVNSDNTATISLEEILGGYGEVNKRTVEELEAEIFFRKPHDARARHVGHVFRGIYNQDYLTVKNNEYLLDLLLNTAGHLQDGIPAGVPAGVEVAHKTGQLPGHAWEDAGIVYGEKTDYVLVILNKRITYATARDKIQRISEVVYQALN